jgi:pimeloyl-ACP methyl ester carboxylesterase
MTGQVGGSPGQLRVREPAWCGAVGLLLVLLTTPARALDFTPCTEPGHAQFACATLPVPVDRSGAVPGTIGLHVERLRGQAPDRPVLLALAGGPGQSATSVATGFAGELEDVLDAVQLVVFDQRGTGVSGALDCENLDTPRGLRRCGGTLGPAGAFYRTADSVLDLDALRAALGVERLVVLGVSYGTFVAAEYARTFPERVQALVLDSPVGPDDVEALEVTTAHATGRVLEALCAGGACAGVTGDPVGDTAALVRRLARRPLRGHREVPGERRARVTVEGVSLLDALVRGDFIAEARALYPAAVAAALAGDRAPLVRLVFMTGGGEESGTSPLAAADELRKSSDALFFATACADTRFPWEGVARPRRRKAALRSAARALPEMAFFPFDRRSLLRYDLAAACPAWPRSSLPGAVVLGPLPDLPVLLLVGQDDLRTPVENAQALTDGLTRAVTVVVPNEGHSVLGHPCAQEKAAQFLRGEPVDDDCDGTVIPRPQVQPVPVALDELPEARGVTGTAGRTLTAVERTLFDASLTFDSGKTVAGLRGGTITCQSGCRFPVLELDGTSLIRGVAVSGTVRDWNATTGELGTASVTVGGRDAAPGSLEFHPDGSVTGRLGDQDVATTSGLARELALLAARRAIPSIVARPRHARP